MVRVRPLVPRALLATLLFCGAAAASAPASRAQEAPGAGDSATAVPGLAPTTAAPAAAVGPDSAGLGPTTGVPWNPPRPMSADEAWEKALRLPGRVASLVPSALGWATRRSLLFVEERNLVPKVLLIAAILPDFGVMATPASLGDRTGIGGTLVIAPKPVRDWLRAEVSGATRGYNTSSLALLGGPARLEYTYDWRSQDPFFGLGLGAREEDQSSYASQGQEARLTLASPRREAGPLSRLRGSAWLASRERVTRRGRDKSEPSFEVSFAPLGAAVLDRKVEHLVYGAGAELDWRSGRPHWSRGFRAAGSAERFDVPVEALAWNDAGARGAQFTRYTAELEAGTSFMRDPRTFRLLLRMTNQEPTGFDGPFLLSDLAKLGGKEGLAGFEPGRFHDLDRVAARLTYIFPLAEHFEFDLHAESGGVYSDLRDARLSAFRSSYGLALRPRTNAAPLAMLGVDWSAEGARVRFALGGVE